MSEFYNRILQVSEREGFKSVNKFALDGLNYGSSEKLNRLKKENAQPSVDILIDISNKFEKINIHWLVTGKGEMELSGDNYQQINEPSAEYDKELIQNQRELIDCYKKISKLEKELSEYRSGKAKAS